MVTRKFINQKTNEEFSKTFHTYKSYLTFMIKCRHSKTIKVVGEPIWA